MSIHALQIPSCITSQYLEEMLKDFLGENSLSVKNYQASPGSAVGDNYICQVLRIQVEYARKNQNETLSIIAKTLPDTDITKELKKNMDFDKVETKMMSETLPLIYKKLKSKIKSESFFPYVYKADIENRILFMEDLKSDGYVMGDRKSSLDLEHCLLVVKSLAQMHAASYLLLQENPDLKNDFLNVYWKRSEGVFPGKVVDGSYSYLLKFLHLWPISEEDKNILRSFEGKMCDLMEESYKIRDKSFNAIIHGDPWTANMMFKYNGTPKSVKLLDYQISNYNSIGLDLIYFLFTSAKEYVKTNHLEDVFKVYYDTFIGVTGEIEGFSLDTVKNEFLERLGFGFVHAATFRCMMIADDGFDIDAFLKGKPAPGNDKIFSEKYFISEFANLLPIFKKYGIFKMQN